MVLSKPIISWIWKQLKKKKSKECIPRRGPGAGHKCVFPFKFLDQTCHGPTCCNIGNLLPEPWCSTKVDKDDFHVKGHYGFCKGTPTCETKRKDDLIYYPPGTKKHNAKRTYPKHDLIFIGHGYSTIASGIETDDGP